MFYSAVKIKTDNPRQNLLAGLNQRRSSMFAPCKRLSAASIYQIMRDSYFIAPPVSHIDRAARTSGRGETRVVLSVYKAQTNFGVAGRINRGADESCGAKIAGRGRKTQFGKCARAERPEHARPRRRCKFQQARGCNRRLQTITCGILVPPTDAHAQSHGKSANTSSRHTNSERVNLLLCGVRYTGCSGRLSLSVCRFSTTQFSRESEFSWVGD